LPYSFGYLWILKGFYVLKTSSNQSSLRGNLSGADISMFEWYASLNCIRICRKAGLKTWIGRIKVVSFLNLQQVGLFLVGVPAVHGTAVHAAGNVQCFVIEATT